MEVLRTSPKITSPRLETREKFQIKIPKILLIQNCATETFGLYEQYLKDEGISYKVFRAYNIESDKEFPSVKEYDAFIVGPTPISANEIYEHEFMMKEWNYIDEIVYRGKPCLGICCGAQILAKYLGADVKKNPVKEIGSYEVRFTEYGRADPIFKRFPPTFSVFHWHSDAFDIPAGATLLVEDDDCKNQAFGYKNVIGLQFHLETTAIEAARWADAYPDDLKAVGKTKEQVVEECKEKEPEMKRLAYQLMSNFFRIV